MAGRIPQRVLGVLIEATGDEWVAYAPDSNTAHALNQAAGDLYSAIDGTTNIGDLSERLDVGVDIIVLGLHELADANLISFKGEQQDDGVIVELDRAGADRRALLIKLGIGSAAAAALPVVETIAAPTRAAAASLPNPTPVPTDFPTPMPTAFPTPMPTMGTPAPSMAPMTPAPTTAPTPGPTTAPTPGPTTAPTIAPTPAPTAAPTDGCSCNGLDIRRARSGQVANIAQGEDTTNVLYEIFTTLTGCNLIINGHNPYQLQTIVNGVIVNTSTNVTISNPEASENFTNSHDGPNEQHISGFITAPCLETGVTIRLVDLDNERILCEGQAPPCNHTPCSCTINAQIGRAVDTETGPGNEILVTGQFECDDPIRLIAIDSHGRTYFTLLGVNNDTYEGSLNLPCGDTYTIAIAANTGINSIATQGEDPMPMPNIICSTQLTVPCPTPAPTLPPTPAPTTAPTLAPTAAPTPAPTSAPTPAGCECSGVVATAGLQIGSSTFYDITSNASLSNCDESPLTIRVERNGVVIASGPQQPNGFNLVFTVRCGDPAEVIILNHERELCRTTVALPCPTPAPTLPPTPAPTAAPTPSPTSAPTAAPTPSPTSAPTAAPTPGPTPAPTPGSCECSITFGEPTHLGPVAWNVPATVAITGDGCPDTVQLQSVGGASPGPTFSPASDLDGHSFVAGSVTGNPLTWQILNNATREVLCETTFAFPDT